MKPRRKKAIIEVGFSWIFILIAGAVILGLFAYIGTTQSSFFETLLQGKLLLDLNTIFRGAEVSRNTAALITIPKTTLEFDSNVFRNGKSSYPLEGRLVFAPPILDTNQIIAWSRPWSIGYRVGNFLYLASPNIKYYIAYTKDSEEAAKELYSELPDIKSDSFPNFKELLCIDCTDRLDRIKSEGYERIHVLVVGYGGQGALQSQGQVQAPLLPTNFYNPANFRMYNKADVVFIYLLRQQSITDGLYTAQIMFADRDMHAISLLDPSTIGPDGRPLEPVYTQSVIDKSALFAAFISGNSEIFQSMMEKAFLHARHVTQVYLYRSRMLERGFACSSFYASSQDRLVEMLGILGRNPLIINDVISKVMELMQDNDLLERFSCPQLF